MRETQSLRIANEFGSEYFEATVFLELSQPHTRENCPAQRLKLFPLRESLVDFKLQLDELLVASNQASDANKHQHSTDHYRKERPRHSLGGRSRHFQSCPTIVALS